MLSAASSLSRTLHHSPSISRYVVAQLSPGIDIATIPRFIRRPARPRARAPSIQIVVYVPSGASSDRFYSTVECAGDDPLAASASAR